MLTQNKFMLQALDLAYRAQNINEIPVGAILVHYLTNSIVMYSHNNCETMNDVTAHAEILGIRFLQAKLLTKILSDYDMYVTLEPCIMCRYAISCVKIRQVFFGAYATTVTNLITRNNINHDISAKLDMRVDLDDVVSGAGDGVGGQKDDVKNNQIYTHVTRTKSGYHTKYYGGILEDKCSALLNDFVQRLR